MARFPVVLDEADDLVGSPPEVSPRRRMLWLVRRLTNDPATAERFKELGARGPVYFRGSFA